MTSLNYLSKTNVNQYINFLLSTPRSYSKIISIRVNNDLSELLDYASANLGISRQMLIKIAVIEFLSRHNIIKDLSVQNHFSIEINNEREEYISRREFSEIENIVNHKKIRNEINTLDKESRQLLKRAERLSSRSWKYNSEEYYYIRNRNEALRKRLLSLKKLKIPKIFYNDLLEIAQRISDIDELLAS